MTPYALWLSLLIALASLSSARGQDITIPITSPPAGASYTACTSCVPINWTSLVGSGDFTLDFNMWRAGTTYAPIIVQENVPYTRGSGGGFVFGMPCSTLPGLYYITASGTSPTGADFSGQSGTFNVSAAP